MAIQINLGERLIRLADRVLSSNTNQTIGQTGGITVSTATDTTVPTTKAVKEYVDNNFVQDKILIPNGSDLNDYKDSGFYYCNKYAYSNIANNPANTFFSLIVMNTNDSNRTKQIMFSGSRNLVYTRLYLDSANGWGVWYELPYIIDANRSISDEYKIIISDPGDSNLKKAIPRINTNHIQDDAGTGYSNIGISSTGTITQTTINSKINDKMGEVVKKNEVINNLTSTDTQLPLSANQGKELKTLIDTKVSIADIQDNLTSTDTNKPLSAKQGRILKSSVDSKANKNHTHENISDSGWQNVIFESGFQNYDTSHPVRYRRIGKIVHLEGIIKNTNAFTPGTTEKKVAFIDDVYCRPSYPQTALMQGSDGNKFLLTINPTGDIDVSRYGTTTATTEVAAGRWLNCYATWMVETENISVETSIIESEDGLNYFLNTYYSSNTSSDSGGIDAIDDGDSINDEQNWTQYDGIPYETFYPYAIQLKNTTNNGGINNKNIQWHIDNTQQTSSVTENNGYAFFKIPYTTWSNKGNHTFTFKFEEDETYRTSSMSTTINYESVTTPTMIVGNIMSSPTFSGILFYEKDTVNESIVLEALPNKTIKCYVNNSLKGTTTTDENGMFSISMGSPSNGASIKIVFEGDMPYREATYNTTYNSGSISA